MKVVNVSLVKKYYLLRSLSSWSVPQFTSVGGKEGMIEELLSRRIYEFKDLALGISKAEF